MPPSLPADVIDQLARRARAAEEQLRKVQREREKRQLKDMTARVGTGPTFTRLIFDIGQTVPVEIAREGDQLTLTFDAALQFDVDKLKPQLPESVQGFSAETSGGMLKVVIDVALKTDMRAFREDDSVIVDFPKPRATGNDSGIVLPSLTKPTDAPVQQAAPAGVAAPKVTRPAPPPHSSRLGQHGEYPTGDCPWTRRLESQGTLSPDGAGSSLPEERCLLDGFRHQGLG